MAVSETEQDIVTQSEKSNHLKVTKKNFIDATSLYLFSSSLFNRMWSHSLRILLYAVLTVLGLFCYLFCDMKDN